MPRYAGRVVVVLAVVVGVLVTLVLPFVWVQAEAHGYARGEEAGLERARRLDDSNG